jgi:enamine deaminase RidA (YjgF/YER057c/UK114 family)
MKKIILPPPPSPVGNYKACVIRNGIGKLSGQFPISSGTLQYHGVIGLDLSIAEAKEAMELTALNVLAQIHQFTEGFESLSGVMRLEAYLASAPGFYQQPSIIDVASDLIVNCLGEVKGAHARTAISVHQLPLNAPIELVASFAIRV